MPKGNRCELPCKRSEALLPHPRNMHKASTLNPYCVEILRSSQSMIVQCDKSYFFIVEYPYYPIIQQLCLACETLSLQAPVWCFSHFHKQDSISLWRQILNWLYVKRESWSADLCSPAASLQREVWWRESVEQAERDSVNCQRILTAVSEERDRLDAALQRISGQMDFISAPSSCRVSDLDFDHTKLRHVLSFSNWLSLGVFGHSCISAVWKAGRLQT